MRHFFQADQLRRFVRKTFCQDRLTGGHIFGISQAYLTRGQFRGRLLMFFARSFKVSGIRFGQTFNSQSTLMVVLYPKISVFHMGICR